MRSSRILRQLLMKLLLLSVVVAEETAKVHPVVKDQAAPVVDPKAVLLVNQAAEIPKVKAAVVVHSLMQLHRWEKLLVKSLENQMQKVMELSSVNLVRWKPLLMMLPLLLAVRIQKAGKVLAVAKKMETLSVLSLIWETRPKKS